jgi:hypothetical protein
MAWQQWITFLTYEEKFLNPIHFINQNYGNNGISQYGKRFEEIKKMFPKPTRITYVGEAFVPNAGTREYHFALTQYYLAPNVFFRTDIMHDSIEYDNGAARITPFPIVFDTVLFNLYSSGHINPATNYFMNNGWHVLKDYNNGLVLLVK